MNITEDIVKQLLNTLVTHEFEKDIVGYDVILRQMDGKTGIGVDVLMPHSMRWDKSLEYSIERRVRNVMKYLSPSFVMVEFYNVIDY